MTLKILVRGGGDVASGAIVRMNRAGWQVLVTELAQPLTVRRAVSFSQTVFSGSLEIEGVKAQLANDLRAANAALAEGFVVVMVDPDASIRNEYHPDVIVDGRMLKRFMVEKLNEAPFIVGLGPGFRVGLNCHAVVETNRGPALGRVYWHGTAQADTGIPENVSGHTSDRVLRAPVDGLLEKFVEIGQPIQVGEKIASVNGYEVKAPFNGVLRGLLQEGIFIKKGTKIGDVDPRGDPALCWLVSDKALSVGGGVLEAILTWIAVKNKRAK